MFGLEGILKLHYFQPPSYGQRHLPLEQVVQGAFQPGLEHFLGWGIHNNIYKALHAPWQKEKCSWRSLFACIDHMDPEPSKQAISQW